MIRRAILPVVILLLVYGFWLSPEFKQICAGVAIFLFGMLALEDGFRNFAGGALDSVLRHSTDRLWKSLSFGVVSTTLVQSSSLISLLTISFLSSGLISLGAGIGIVFGANLGTTTGAWLVAAFGLKVSLSVYAMPLLVFGVLLIFQRERNYKGIGYVLLGISFLFFGIDYMKQGFETFRSTIDLSQYAVAGLKGVLLYAAIGIAATVVMQSSHAVLVLILAGLSAGQVGYENALALAIGSNVGTTVTAIIGSLGANQDGKRLAAAHLVFNSVTGAVAILFIAEFMRAVAWLGAALGLTSDTTLLALFHTLFNLVGLLLMIPFIGPMERFLSGRFLAAAAAVKKPKFLNAASTQFPDTAVEAVRNETIRLYEITEKIIAHALALHRSNLFSDRDLQEVVMQSRKPIREDINEKYALNVKALYAAIVEFTSSSLASSDGRHLEHLHELRNVGARIVEAVKDVKHLQKNLAKHTLSSNLSVRGEYDNIRVLIAETLRSIRNISEISSEEVTVLLYDEARLTLAQADIVADGTLDRLIREHRLSAEMATSLMNDNVYASRACQNLLYAAETLFVRNTSRSGQAEVSVSLEDHEIEMMASHPQTPPQGRRSARDT